MGKETNLVLSCIAEAASHLLDRVPVFTPVDLPVEDVQNAPGNERDDARGT